MLRLLRAVAGYGRRLFVRVIKSLSPAILVAAVLYSAALLLVGLAIGDWASDRGIKERVVAALHAISADDGTKQTVSWEPLYPLGNLHTLERAAITLAPFETRGDGGAIEEIGGYILIASPTGQLQTLSPDHVLSVLDVRVPTNLEGLQNDPIYSNPRFVIAYFRVLDLISTQRSADSYDLYVSHHRFGDGCFELVVSRTSVETAADGLHVSDDWEDVFVAEPCMYPKDADLLWAGVESGGRLQFRDPQTLLLTTGDHQFDGVRSETPLAQDPSSQLGKVISIDLPSGQARIFASGLRNPQGLLVTRDGVIWETEHGPQGGDEINVIRDGANYGWPNVTYGVDYGGEPRRDWPRNPEQGRHDGYEHPAFSFVPSIGITNLIQPDPREFPLWRDHLIVACLGGYAGGGASALYVLRIEDGNDPVYAEPLRIQGEELRDIISLSDGRIAVLTDSGKLLLFRNRYPEPTHASPQENEFVVSLDASAEAAVATMTAQKPPTLAERGRLLFASECASCHAAPPGQVGVAPSLRGVVGRRIGSLDGFQYSQALTGHSERWSETRLADYLTKLEPEYPGSAMPPAVLSYEDAVAVVAFLRSQ